MGLSVNISENIRIKNEVLYGPNRRAYAEAWNKGVVRNVDEWLALDPFYRADFSSPHDFYENHSRSQAAAVKQELRNAAPPRTNGA